MARPAGRASRWDAAVTLPVTTLDALAAAHGRPRLIKIDVEGYEAAALAGLAFAPRTLSFEFTTIQRGVAADCLDRLAGARLPRLQRLPRREHGVRPSRPRWTPPAWPPGSAALPAEANSGDVYASTEPARIA